MTPFAIGVVAGLAFLQASIAGPRQSFTDCLKRASLQAEVQKVAANQYAAFAKQHCSEPGERFVAALVAFDVKNGVKRAQAASDAQLQVEDYLAMSAERYEAKAPKSGSAPTPPAVQAAVPAEPDQ